MAATTRKRKRKQSSDPGDPPYLYEKLHARMELDSHADTCTVGMCAKILQKTGRTVTVNGFEKQLGNIPDIDVVTAAVAYDCPYTFRTYILIFHEALHVPTMTTSLLNPNQLRDQGLIVNDLALQYMKPEDRSTTSHSILSSDPALHIPLSLDGTMSGFTIREPTWEEIQDIEESKVTFVHMTSSQPWDPYSPHHADIEQALRDDVVRGKDVVPHESRDLSQLQVRGQFEGTALQGTVQPDRLFKPEALVSREALRQEQKHLGALEVDRYADFLLQELGVTERGLGALSKVLASAKSTKQRAGFVDAQQLAKNWKIGVDAAKRTVEATTQLAVRDFSTVSGGRRLKPAHWVLKRKRIQADVYTDTLYGRCKSLRGNTHAQIFATPFQFVRAFPMASKGDAHYALDDFFDQVGVPQVMIPDGAKEMTQGDFVKKCRKAQCPMHPVEAYTPNLNAAEGTIRELKRHYRRVMLETGAPEVLWDYCLEWCSLIRSHTAHNIRALCGETPATMMTGDTSDISMLAEFGWYDWVWYITIQGQEGQDGTKESSMGIKKLGRYLGPAIGVGEAMCGTVFTEKGTTVHRTSIMPLSELDLNSEPTKKLMAEFEKSLAGKLKERIKGMKDGKPAEWLEEKDSSHQDDELTPDHVPYEEWTPAELGFDIPPDKQPLPEIPEADDLNLNKYLAAKVMLPRDGHTFASGRVVKRARNPDGELIGREHSNPLLDTSVYEVEFEDGSVEKYNANIIAEHIYSQVDEDGFGRTLLDEIIDHKRDDSAIDRDDGYVRGPNGSRVPKKTTKGWKLLVRLKDHRTEWFKLKDLKESNPLEVAQYAVDNKLDDEPAFKWWVPYTIRKRNRILKAMQKRYFRTHQKFGIELPKTVKRALEIDEETGTTFWRDAIKKEMGTVMVAFDILPEGAEKPVGYSFISCHIVFDVKQGTLQRKARLVANGAGTEPDVPTYASVVSRESVRIAFTIAALNGLDVLAADCEGAYLNAPSRERTFTKCGPEFGEYAGRYAIIVRALYGQRGSAASWRAKISEIIESLGYQMCRADNDVWMKKGVNAAGEPIWEYVLVYSDDLLMIGLHPEETAAFIHKHCKLKDGSVKPPDQYLGANIGKMLLANGTWAWYASSDSYCQAAIKNVEMWLEKRKEKLPTRQACVFPSNWKPELDITPELGDDDAHYYQQQIGVLRWMVELGRVDICTEVSMLAAFSAAPRQGHLAAVLHLYGYLKKNTKSKMVFDPTPMEHGEPEEVRDWGDFYKPYKEVIPSDMPEPRGKAIQTTCFVDSDHAGDAINRRSRTGVLVYCGMAPIIFYSKKQGSIETSSFGSELSAMKTAVELVEGLRYKLRMMGIPLEGTTRVYADNMSVVHNCSKPESQLKKKSNSIAYHYVRERCAGPRPVCSISYIPTQDNLADMFTKSQPGEVRKRLAERVLY